VFPNVNADKIDVIAGIEVVVYVILLSSSRIILAALFKLNVHVYVQSALNVSYVTSKTLCVHLFKDMSLNVYVTLVVVATSVSALLHQSFTFLIQLSTSKVGSAHAQATVITYVSSVKLPSLAFNFNVPAKILL
jgi:hypothetical protein